MFSPIPLNPVFFNPDDSPDWNTSQDSGQDDYTDVNTPHNLDHHNSDHNFIDLIDDYYGNVDESNYSDDYSDGYENYAQSENYGDDDVQVLNSDITVHHKHRHKHYLVKYDYKLLLKNLASLQGYI